VFLPSAVLTSSTVIPGSCTLEFVNHVLAQFVNHVTLDSDPSPTKLEILSVLMAKHRFCKSDIEKRPTSEEAGHMFDKLTVPL
jgi:hypothetical protein